MTSDQPSKPSKESLFPLMTRLRERQENLKLFELGPFTKTHKNLCTENENFGKLNLNLSGTG
jgi:hypothetical protein